MIRAKATKNKPSGIILTVSNGSNLKHAKIKQIIAAIGAILIPF
jgi:hypothetical protein